MFFEKHAHAFIIKGDFMSGEGIFDGDYVVIESRKEIEDGDIAFIYQDMENAILSRVYKDKGNVILQPSNPNMKLRILEETKIKIQGVVIGIIRCYFKH